MLVSAWNQISHSVERDDTGHDFLQAVKRWAGLEQAPNFTAATFKQASDVYVREVLPTKARRTQVDNLKELVFLREFFDDDALLEEIEPVHIKQYLR